MLAGLLFAIAEAEDRPGRLAATLPFGGLTLIEYQARTLIAAGAAQIVVVVARVTPELLGALDRIRRRGAAVDPVRSAREAAETLHPLARVVMLADGLVATDAVVDGIAHDAGDALLVLPLDEAPPEWERVGGQMAWAGAARFDARRIGELSRLPADYDIASSLLRLSEQAGAVHLVLPTAVLRHGHGIERRAASLAARGRLVLAQRIGGRQGWFDRWVLGPVARLALPALVDRGVAGSVVCAGAAMLAAIAVGSAAWGIVAIGAVLALVACLTLEIGATLGELRDEHRLECGARWGVRLLPAAVALAAGWSVGSGAALVLAPAAIAAGAIAERAIARSSRRRWWGSPPAYLSAFAVAAVAGVPVLGLAAAAGYATATLADAVEALRRQA